MTKSNDKQSRDAEIAIEVARKKAEQSNADNFNTHFAKKASEREIVDAFALSANGDDCVIGADYVLTCNSRFVLIEFKDKEKDIKAEERKERRHLLCKLLPDNFGMQFIHNKCHFIAWAASTNAVDSTIISNVYSNEVCNAKIMSSSLTDPKLPDTTTRINVDEFVKLILSAKDSCTASLEEFEIYLKWLLQETSGSEESTIRLVMLDPTVDYFLQKDFKSVSAANDWLVTLRDKFVPVNPDEDNSKMKLG